MTRIRNILLMVAPVALLGAGCAADGTSAPSVDLDGSTGPGSSSITINDGADRCTGDIAADTFRYALCSCENIRMAGTLRTVGFDSRSPMSSVEESGAAVGANGVLSQAGGSDIGGSLTLAGGGWSFAGTNAVRGDLRINGDLAGAGFVHVYRDAYVNGGVTVAGDAQIDRDLHTSGTGFGFGTTVGGETIEEAVEVASPCACAEDELLNIEAIVSDAAEDNYNADAGWNIGALSTIVGSVEQTLGGGRYYVDNIRGAGSLTLNVTEDSALFVGGDLSLAGGLRVEVEPEADLDIFIAGSFGLSGVAELGTPEDPSSVRVYVGGDGVVALAGTARFVGNLYAPRAQVALATPLFEVYGSIFAGDFAQAGNTVVYYDRSIIDEGDGCEEPPPAQCDSCDDCTGGTACVDGSCGACRTDADCCEPLTCNQETGRCEQLVYCEPEECSVSDDCLSTEYCYQGCCLPSPI